MSWLIYRHISPSGKSYIGQTKNLTRIRFRNGQGYKHCTVFYNAIEKYGWDSFVTEILEEDIPTQEKANDREKYWIQYYHSLASENGYNLTEGGQNSGGINSYKPVVQIDMKSLQEVARFRGLIEAQNATGVDRSQIAHCCDRQEGCISAQGYYWAWERDYSSEWKPQELIPIDYSFAEVGVVQIDMRTLKVVGTYDSIAKASAKTGIAACNITMATQFQTYRSAGGYFWVRSEEYADSWQPPVYIKNRPILQLDKNSYKIVKKYFNLTEVKQSFKENVVQVSRCLERKARTAYGFCWCYKDEYSENWAPISAYQRQRYRSVICVETKQHYHSIKEAVLSLSEDLSLQGRRTGILRACQGKAQTYGGYHWKFEENEK